MGGVQRRRRRVFVVLAHFQPQHPVFHHVVAADSVRARHLVQVVDHRDRVHLGSVHRDRHARLERDLDLGLVVRRLGRPVVDPVAGHVARVLQLTALDRPTPQVRVDRQLPAVARLHGQVVVVRVRDLPLAGQP